MRGKGWRQLRGHGACRVGARWRPWAAPLDLAAGLTLGCKYSIVVRKNGYEMTHAQRHACGLPLAAGILLLFYTVAVASMVFVTTPRHGYTTDPEYCYLFSMLSAARMQRVFYTDHPGGPLHMFGALALRVAHVFGTHDDLVYDVVSRPEAYLCAVNAALYMMFVLILTAAAWLAWRVSGRVLSAVCVMLTPVVCLYHLTWSMSQVRAEAMLYSAGLGLVAVLFALQSTWRERHPAWLACLAAVSVGFGTATKLGFAPLALCPLLLVPQWRWKLLYVLLLPVSFAVWLGPALRHFSVVQNVLPWITRSGTYGWGRSAWDSRQALIVLRELLRTELIFFVVIGLAAVIVCVTVVRMMACRRQAPRTLWLLLAVLAAIAIQILLVVRGGMANYAVPSLALSGCVLACCCELVHWCAGSFARLGQCLSLVCAAGITAAGLWHHVPQVRMRCYFLSVIHQHQQAIHHTFLRDYRDYTPVYHYYDGHQPFALFLGNGFAGFQYADVLEAVYPRTRFYTWATQPPHFCAWDNRAALSFDSLWFEHDKIVFVGSTFDNHPWYRPALPLREVKREGAAALTVVDRERVWTNELRACEAITARTRWDMLAARTAHRMLHARFDHMAPDTTTVAALTPTGHLLTVITPTNQPGCVWDVCGFRAANRRLEWPDAPGLNSTGDCTFACLVRIGDKPGWQVPFGHGLGTSSSSSPWFFLCVNDSREIHFVMQFVLPDGTPREVRVGHALPAAGYFGWHVLAGTYSQQRNEVALYVDGVQAATADVPASAQRITNPAPLTIGSLAGGTLPFLGYIREVLAFDRALSARELAVAAP